MNVVSRIRFPRTPETSGLYMKCDEGTSLNFYAEHAEVVLANNCVLSLNTYFNSFYEKFYAKYTELYSLYYLLKLEGNFQISIYREQYGTENRELIHTQNFENCQPLEPVKIMLPDSWRGGNAGRVYLEITCLSDRGSFTGGFIATEQPKITEVSLAIITCTFKKEVYVKNTISAILKDDFLQDKKFKVFVVDNGTTLKKDDFDDPRVQLIPNRNVGGSGGFTRGLIQALQEDVHTHFLFMDDDIELESESIYRLFPLYEYANKDFAVSGSMLDFYKKYVLFEAGALYGKSIDTQGNPKYKPFKVTSLKPGLNLENSTVINLLLSEDSPDYGGFWFFCFSKKTVKEIGLPLPFFIKIDDMEFGLRMRRCLGNSIVAFPGIAVWHEPFYAKNPVWDSYYVFRNHLVTHSIHNSLSYIDAVIYLTINFLRSLFLFDYNTALLLINSFEDYMKGPLFLETTDPETLHGSVVALSKSYNSQTGKPNSFPNNQYREKLSLTTLKKFIGILTLNGHLLPNFLLSNEPAYCWGGSDYTDYWFKTFGKKRIIFAKEGNNSTYQHEMNRFAGIRLLIRWLQVIIKNTTKWSSVKSEWKNAFKRLTSIEFWREYLRLNEQT